MSATDHVKAIKAAFKQVDKDGTGSLNVAQVKVVLEKVLNEPVDDDTVEAFMEEVDKDKSGTVEEEELVEAMKKWLVEHEKTAKAEGETSSPRQKGQSSPEPLARFLKSFKGKGKKSVADDRAALGKFVLSSESTKIKKDIVDVLNKNEVAAQKFVVFQVFLNRIFHIDDVAQEINLDMYLKLNWRSAHWVGKTDDDFQEDEQKTEWWEPGVEVSNAIELEKQTEEDEAFWLEIPEDGILAYTQRYIGTVSVHMDLHQFPFDKQLLSINFESFHWKEQDMKMVVLEQFKSQTTPPPGEAWHAMSNEVKLHDWSVDEIQVVEKGVHYDFEDRTYSRVQVRLKLARSYRYYFLKILTVLWFIVGMSWCIFFTDPDDVTGRLAITVTLFLAAVAFNFVIGSALPKVPYNTLLDQNVLVAYAYIAATIVEELIIYQVSQSGTYAREEVLHGEWWFALAFAGTYILYNLQWIATSLYVRHRNRHYRDPAELLLEDDEPSLLTSKSVEGAEMDENVRLV